MTPTSEALDKIQTHDLATERVYRDGDIYELRPHSPIETSGSCPALVYDAEEQTIWSKGGRKHDVKVEEVDLGPFGSTTSVKIVDTFGRDLRKPWRFGGPDTPDTNQRQIIQRKRAYALISYALDA